MGMLKTMKSFFKKDFEDQPVSAGPANFYKYNAIVAEVYDGDTVTLDIDLGFGVWKTGEKIRLNGLNAPEVRGDEKTAGLKSRDYLREMILGKQVVLQTIKDKQGKYGRYLGVIIINGINVNAQLILDGMAEPRVYQKGQWEQ